MDTTVHIVVKDVDKRRGLQDPTHMIIWHPLDQLTGFVIVRTAVPLLLDEATLHFQGASVVWTKAIRAENEITTSKREHKVRQSDAPPDVKNSQQSQSQFLSQLHEPLHFERIENSSSYSSGYIAPYHFVIPRWVLVQSADVPDQCLGLPPSLRGGQLPKMKKELEKFAQAQITYHLHLKAVLRTSETSQAGTHEAWEEIALVPYTERLPPTDTQDFPAEFVLSMSNTFQTSIFGHRSNTMTMRIDEPAALELGKASCATEIEIYITVETTPGEGDATRVDRMNQRLVKVTFEVNVGLRAKTFYSTANFPRLPSQSTLTSGGPLRLSDQVLKLNSVTARPAPWNHVLQESRPPHSETGWRHSVQSGSLHGDLDGVPTASASSSETSVLQGKWNTTIRLPISTPSSMLPTFCSAIVARQYSLIIHGKARGITIKPFALEVPVQVIYPPPDSAHHFVATDGQTSMNMQEPQQITKESAAISDSGLAGYDIQDAPRDAAGGVGVRNSDDLTADGGNEEREAVRLDKSIVIHDTGDNDTDTDTDRFIGLRQKPDA